MEHQKENGTRAGEIDLMSRIQTQLNECFDSRGVGINERHFVAVLQEFPDPVAVPPTPAPTTMTFFGTPVSFFMQRPNLLVQPAATFLARC